MNYNYISYDEKCPQCGYCRHCGRSNTPYTLTYTGTGLDFQNAAQLQKLGEMGEDRKNG